MQFRQYYFSGHGWEELEKRVALPLLEFGRLKIGTFLNLI